MEIEKLKEEEVNYFLRPSSSIDFISSGCKLLDCVLGGGYPIGRIVNIVGDKAAGKSLLCIEAAANFLNKYPEGIIRYAEAEAAFDQDYARALGLPVSKTEFVDNCVTVEDFFEDLEDTLDRLKDLDTPCLYILDSLDALSDRAELKRDLDEGSYGVEKAKKMSQLFRRLVQRLENLRVCIIIVSQVRDNIGVVFGKRYSRSGGRSLDFYASQVIYLAISKTLKVMKSKVERPVGVEVKARCEKNKIGLPFRNCTFPIIFGYGVDDLMANLAWLEEIGDIEKGDAKKKNTEYKKLPNEEFFKVSDEVASKVEKMWFEIEAKFLPTRRKYNYD